MHGWYAAARVVGTKGLDGKLRLASASAFLRFAGEGAQVAFVPPREDGPRTAAVSSVEQMGEDACLASFEGVEGLGVAERLIGCAVLLEGESPASAVVFDALGWLSGAVLEDVATGRSGVIEEVDAARERIQPLLHVRLDDGTRALVPFVDDLIVDADEAESRLVMDLPRGLLDG